MQKKELLTMKQPTRHQRPKPPQSPSVAIVTLAGPMTALAYMLSVVQDEHADPSRRDRMAICAAQYCHPRMSDLRKGVKDLQAEAAAEAGTVDHWAGDLQYANGRRR